MYSINVPVLGGLHEVLLLQLLMIDYCTISFPLKFGRCTGVLHAKINVCEVSKLMAIVDQLITVSDFLFRLS